MSKTFKVEVVTPEATALSTEASSLQVRAWEGYLGIMANHAPLLAVLLPGVLTLRDEAGRPSFYALRGGFMEVANNRAVILADAIEKAEEVSVEAAKKAYEESLAAPAPAAAPPGATAETRQKLRDLALEEQQAKRDWAEARLKAVEHAREGK
ncbi:MAG TPA: ATP synthase F1 subunit epsilon [Planctomycetota bacterium]|nr:ATP synthase F1 subunit epsilon [Planctomycetota bacterium]